MKAVSITIAVGEKMNATEVRKEQSARVIALHHPLAQRERLISLGISKGAILTNHVTTLFHDPILFEVEDRLVAIRRSDAALIEVIGS